METIARSAEHAARLAVSPVYLRNTVVSNLDDALAIVAEQAEDEGLWFIARTAPEAYLQQELRRLHAALEGVSPEECAARVLSEHGANDE